ncbi:hypothetical protein [Pseudomonas oryzihabitans]|uniref:HEPN AbiU2-like domain-containing protein n=1 Tax=Pseudomonas oryzihabitans TaxID=47885 RepID=A0AAJ2BQQ7_9PSED|nr:hypothetical protein [Pseudomonas psychrotolerans]MDR6236777.1 hypothetical protein [Pseudomonas psychrotolerans]
MSDEPHQGPQDKFVESMGQELGVTFYHLHTRLIELHIVWQQYRQLFADSEDTIELLNRTAGLFFKIVQDELWDSVLLGISRMTDPAATKHNKNLTINSLPPLIKNNPKLRMEVEELCQQAVFASSFAREHRNKRIAHQDHAAYANRKTSELSGISRKLIEGMLKALRETLNRIDNELRDTTVFYEDFIDESGARVLVNRLRKLEPDNIAPVD